MHGNRVICPPKLKPIVLPQERFNPYHEYYRGYHCSPTFTNIVYDEDDDDDDDDDDYYYYHSNL